MIKTTKGKLYTVFLSLIVLMALIGTFSVMALLKVEKSVEGLMTDNYKSIHAISNMLEAIENQNNAIFIYITTDKQKGIELFYNAGTNFKKWHAIEINNITEAGESQLVEKTMQKYEEFLLLFSKMQEVSKNSSSETTAQNDTTTFYHTNIKPLYLQIRTDLRQIAQINEGAMIGDKSATIETTRMTVSFVLILFMVTLLVGFVVSGFFINKFLKPLHLLEESLKKVKSGESDCWDGIIDIDSDDEIGRLAKEFNNMLARLRKFDQSNIGNLITERNKSVTIVKNISDPLVVLDMDFRITLVNKAFEQVFNISEEKIINRHFLEAVKNGEIFDHIMTALKSNNSYFEKIVRVSEEREYYFNVVATSIQDNENKISGMAVLFKNITELKELEKLKTDFIATISHEIKTPLTSILMGASLLSDNNLGKLTFEQSKILNAIKEDGENISTLVKNLIELSKIESTIDIFNFDQYTIQDIVNNALKQFTDIASNKNINILVNIEDNLPTAFVDFEKIIWVLNNLLSNAIRHTYEGGLIQISARQENHFLFVTVKDNGEGIESAILENIFEQIFFVGKEDSFSKKGMGLSLSKKIIDAHNGEIFAKSQKNLGSEFTFSLPISNKW